MKHFNIGAERLTRREQKQQWHSITRAITTYLDEAVRDPSLLEDADGFADILMVRASRLYLWAQKQGKDAQSKLERQREHEHVKQTKKSALA